MPVSDLWRLTTHDFRYYELADVLVERFVEVGVDALNVEARITGQCIVCGAQGVTGWLQIGRIDPEIGEFRSIVPDSTIYLA
jgi:hypothetical protein